MQSEKSADLMKNKCMHNWWGSFSKTNVVLWGIEASVMKCDKGAGVSKNSVTYFMGCPILREHAI